jgi:anti-sigma regulatory factor (Ser/Thr protein kinase)
MSLNKQKRNEIRGFILWNIRDHPSDIVRFSQNKFNLSRTAILRYIHNLKTENFIDIQGSTKNIKYVLKPLHTLARIYKLQDSLAEDRIWRNDVLPLFEGIKENVVNICQYGFTEIFNNAIDHSEGTEVKIEITIWIDKLSIEIADDGVGIFNKIQQRYNLEDPLHAILELSKGKLTTEPASHTGEGIFFTSRMFDSFIIGSGNLCFGSRTRDLFFETNQNIKGTLVGMEISPISERTTTSVFSKFISNPDDYSFDKTIFPVELARYGNENLVSRSQAKRLLTRLERFKTVVLDFENMESIGRAFADEIFRVFVNSHPNTTILTTNDNKSIKQLIKEVQSGNINNVINQGSPNF